MTTPPGLLDGQFTLGIEEEFQIVHAETREAPLVREPAASRKGMTNAMLRRARPARDAPVDGRDWDGHLPRHQARLAPR